MIADSECVLILPACTRSLAKYSPKPVIYADGLGKVTPGLSTRDRSFELTMCGQNHSFELMRVAVAIVLQGQFSHTAEWAHRSCCCRRRPGRHGRGVKLERNEKGRSVTARLSLGVKFHPLHSAGPLSRSEPFKAGAGREYHPRAALGSWHGRPKH